MSQREAAVQVKSERLPGFGNERLRCRGERSSALRVRATSNLGHTSWFNARLVYIFDGVLDLAVIRVEAASTMFAAVPVCRSSLQAGEPVTVVRKTASLSPERAGMSSKSLSQRTSPDREHAVDMPHQLHLSRCTFTDAPYWS